MDLEEAATAFREFVSVIKALRTPGTGCPWDLEQNHLTLRPYLIEEAYEVIDAIDRGEDRAVQEELGDLLLQVVLHAQVAEDRDAFSIREVIQGITEKMVRRHPHVFGSVQVSGSAEVLRNWAQIKAAEEQPAGKPAQPGLLSRVPESMPALLRAEKLGEKAARVHFDRGSIVAILGDVRRELAELEEQLHAESPQQPRTTADELRARLEHGLGDLFFSLCQLARRLGLAAEGSLRASNRRFVERFQRMEQQAPRLLQELDQEELEAEWRNAKKAEQPNPGEDRDS